MKEIGESFKEARETIGISKSEVIKDLGKRQYIEKSNERFEKVIKLSLAPNTI